MFNNEHFSKLSANGVEVALRCAQIALESTERLCKLQLEASKDTLEGHAKIAHKLSDISNPQEAMAHFNKLTTQTIEKTFVHSRDIYDIVSQTQSEFARLTEDNLDTLNKSLVNSIDTLSKNVPAGSNAAIDALKSSFTTAAAAINSFTRTTQQMAEFANTSAKAATNVTADAVKNASKRSANTVS